MAEPFDWERGRLSMSPRTAWALGIAFVTIGGGIAANQFQLFNISNTVAEMRKEQADDRDAMVTKEAHYVACLEQERANKNWKCPMAPPLTVDNKPRRVATAKPKPKPAPTESPFKWPGWGLDAFAQGK